MWSNKFDEELCNHSKAVNKTNLFLSNIHAMDFMLLLISINDKMA